MSPDNRDLRVGQNIKACREAIGMSQADLAAEMTAAGFPGFYPQTITKIEQGARSLKYAEGVTMSAVFGIDADAFFEGGQLTPAERSVMGAAATLHARRSQVVDSFNGLRQAYADLLTRLEASGVGEETVLQARRAIAAASPEKTAGFLAVLADDTERIASSGNALGADGHGEHH